MPQHSSVVSLEYALSDWVLNEYPFSVINGEEIAKQIFRLYKSKSYGIDKIARIRSDEPRLSVYHSLVLSLTRAGVISEIEGFHSASSSTYPFNGSYIIKSKPEYSAPDAACVIYPYAHLAYLSAMERHGLTLKNPQVIYLGMPARETWKTKAKANLNIDFDYSINFSEVNFMPKYPSKNIIFGMSVIPVSEKDQSGIIRVTNSPVMITSPARTFVDMTRKPDFCGGADDAVESFLENAKPFRKQIIKYTNDYGGKIDKARVGFLLDSVMGISDPIIDSWQKEAVLSRGSSKVLIPGAPFSEHYSPEWSLSLNLKSMHKYGVA